MKPEVPRVLTGLAGTVMRSLSPELATPFARTNAATTAGLLNMIAMEFDGAAARHVEENDVLRAILADGARLATDGELRSLLEALVAGQPDRDYKVSTLKAENDELRAALIELHIHVESRDDAAADEMDERIWAELRASVARRTLTRG